MPVIYSLCPFKHTFQAIKQWNYTEELCAKIWKQITEDQYLSHAFVRLDKMSSARYVRKENQEACHLYGKFYEVIAKMQNLRQ